MSKVWFILVLQSVGFCTYAQFTTRQAHDAQVKKEAEAAFQLKNQQITNHATNIANQNKATRAAMKKNR